MSCGTALAQGCAGCGVELLPGAGFCHHCGTKSGEAPTAASPAPPQVAPPVPTPPAQPNTQVARYIPDELKGKLETVRSSRGMEGERRIVTMLFCDVQGSTAAAERLDPEEWTEIMNGAFEHLIAPVYQFEGTVARLMGDSILAFFGAPIAHEDDPERAILAGLEILESIQPYRKEMTSRWDLDFNVRVGINTGLVVVGAVGSDLLVEYTALGDAVNLAARMEQTASPGTIQIADNTYRLVAPLFEFEDLGGIEAKGKSELVQSYRVIAPKAERGILRGIQGLDSPLVGRDAEFSDLNAAVQKLASGQGQIFSVMGEAGLGKSRLISELKQKINAEGTTGVGSDGTQAAVNWCEGRSLSYESGIPYAPFKVLLEDCLGISGDLAEEQKYEVIQSRLATLAGDEEENLTPYIANVLGIPSPPDALEKIRYMMPPELRESVFNALVNFFEYLAMKQPVILMFEDVHWIDPTSKELLERLLGVTERASLMVLCAFRPWRDEPAWEIHELALRDYGHRYGSTTLNPLDGNDARKLVSHLLAVDDLPERVRSMILQQSEGNPFFLEEVIRSLLDAGIVIREGDHWIATREIETISVPETLTGVITARFDQLSDQAKRVAQLASVIGREFGFNALSELYDMDSDLDGILVDLQRRELVREIRRIPEREYRFKHALTQDTIYNSVLLSRRRQTHRKLAECIERQAPDKSSDIARHYLDAGEQVSALPHLVAAGEKAFGAYSHAEAVTNFQRALEILEWHPDPGLHRRAFEGLGGSFTFTGRLPESVAAYEQMLGVATDSGNASMQISAYNKLGFVTGVIMGQTEKAENYLALGSTMATEISDYPGLAEYHITECYLRTASGDLDGAKNHQTDARELGSEQGFEVARLFGLSHYANTLAYTADFDDSYKAAEVARDAAQEVGNQQYLAEVLGHTIPLNHMRNGELERAYDISASGLEIAQKIGATAEISIAAFTHGVMAGMRGRYEEAIKAHKLSDKVAFASGYNYLEMVAKCSIGTLYLEISPQLTERALEWHNGATEVRAKPLGNAFGAFASAEIGFRELKAGNLDTAMGYFKEGLEQSTAAKYLARPALLVGSAFVNLMTGSPEVAGEAIAEAREFATTRSMKHFYPMIEWADGGVNLATEKPEEALVRFNAGAVVAREIGAEPWVWQNLGGAAKSLVALGRTQEAEQKKSEARVSIDSIGAHFSDDELKKLFVDNAVGSLA